MWANLRKVKRGDFLILSENHGNLLPGTGDVAEKADDRSVLGFSRTDETLFDPERVLVLTASQSEVIFLTPALSRSVL